MYREGMLTKKISTDYPSVFGNKVDNGRADGVFVIIPSHLQQ